MLVGVSLPQPMTSATLRARIANEGNLGVAAGVPVTFRYGTPESPGEVIGTVSTEVPLLPGASTLVEIEAPLTGEAPYAFFATVDDDGSSGGIILECDEANNGAGIGDVDCDIIF